MNKNNIIVDHDIFMKIAKRSVCPECFESKMVCRYTNRQIDTRIRIFCSNCEYVLVDNDSDSELSVRKKGIHAVTLALCGLCCRPGSL